MVKEIKFKWKDVAPDAIPVQDSEGTVGLLTEEEWFRAVERAQQAIIQILSKEVKESKARREEIEIRRDEEEGIPLAEWGKKEDCPDETEIDL